MLLTRPTMTADRRDSASTVGTGLSRQPVLAAGRPGLLPLGPEPRPGQGRDETIIDTFAQAYDEGVTLLARQGQPSEHAVRRRLLVFNQDLVEQSNGRPVRIVTTPSARVTVARVVQLTTPVR